MIVWLNFSSQRNIKLTFLRFTCTSWIFFRILFIRWFIFCQAKSERTWVRSWHYTRDKKNVITLYLPFACKVSSKYSIINHNSMNILSSGHFKMGKISLYASTVRPIPRKFYDNLPEKTQIFRVSFYFYDLMK